MTTQEKWDKAAADAHDALHRLVELKDHIEAQVENTWMIDDEEQREGEEELRREIIEAIIDADLDAALETAAAMEDFTVPAWAAEKEV